MSGDAQNLPDDPAALKAIIAALQAENAKISAILRAHDQLIQSLRLRIAKLRKQAFGQSSEKIEREIEQLQLALEDLMIAAAETDAAPVNETDMPAGTADADRGRGGHVPAPACIGKCSPRTPRTRSRHLLPRLRWGSAPSWRGRQ